jgi:uncharacterized protein (TIGR03083 family)
MDAIITTADMLDALRRERAAWEALLAQVPPQRLAEPGVDGDWSVKDVVAHIAFFEWEMVRLLETRSLAGASDLWGLPTDARNAAIYQQVRDRPLDAVLANSKQAYVRLLTAVGGLPDSALRDPTAFEGMPPDWVPLDIIAQNSTEHYAAHAQDIRAWLETGD